MAKAYVGEFVEVVQADEHYKRYKSVLKTVIEGADITAIKAESKTAHATRQSRSLYLKRVIPNKLIDAEAQDSSVRSRLTELKVMLINEQELLQTTISLTKKHLKATYPDAFTGIGSNATARNSVLDRLFLKGSEYLMQLNTAVTILDLYIKDIDASGYKHTNIREAMKLELGGRKEVV